MDPRHIVDGHREKTLSFLWSIILHFQVRRRYKVLRFQRRCRTLRFPAGATCRLKRLGFLREEVKISLNVAVN